MRETVMVLEVPPECVEAENATLSYLLVDGGARKNFQEMGGDARCFTRTRREIFQSIVRQNCDGDVNIVAIKNDLIENHHTSESALMTLTDICEKSLDILPSQISSYNRKVLQYRKRRKVHAEGLELCRKANSNNGEWADVDEWEEPIPFDDYSKLPRFPAENLPPMAFEMVEQVSKVNQVDVGLPASMYLSALSTSLSKKVLVDLGTHKESVNLYTCPILDSGERKTATMRIMMSPIFDYQARKKAEKIGDTEPPIFVVDDITTECLFKVMSENDERMSVISAEGGIFGIMAGKYNSKGFSNFDLYLKGHSGDPCSSHRIGREAQYMHAPSLTMCLAVQRDVIREIGRNEQFRGRGLLGRFLYSLCQPQAGYRTRQIEKISEDLLECYSNHIQKLMEIPLELQELKFTPDAQDSWNRFYNECEADMQQGGKLALMKDWGSKLAGAVARIAGLLHYAEHGEKASGEPISVNIVDGSVAICKYYREHAMAVFGQIGEDPQVESASKILEYLKLHKPNTFKGRDVLRGKSGFRNMDTVNLGLNYLVCKNYIKESFVNSVDSFRVKGRPEGVTYCVNPKIYTIKS